MKIKRKITINGTDVNPFHKLGLTQNPFPQIGKAEWDAGELALNSLAGDPVKSAADIQARLKGKVSQELIDLCIAQFKPGVEVHFEIVFEE
jgi:hypothetical protein